MAQNRHQPALCNFIVRVAYDSARRRGDSKSVEIVSPDEHAEQMFRRYARRGDVEAGDLVSGQVGQGRCAFEQIDLVPWRYAVRRKAPLAPYAESHDR